MSVPSGSKQALLPFAVGLLSLAIFICAFFTSSTRALFDVMALLLSMLIKGMVASSNAVSSLTAC